MRRRDWAELEVAIERRDPERLLGVLERANQARPADPKRSEVVQKGCGALVKMVVGRMEIALDHGKRALAVLAALQRSTPDAGPLSQVLVALGTFGNILPLRAAFPPEVVPSALRILNPRPASNIAAAAMRVLSAFPEKLDFEALQSIQELCLSREAESDACVAGLQVFCAVADGLRSKADENLARDELAGTLVAHAMKLHSNEQVAEWGLMLLSLLLARDGEKGREKEILPNCAGQIRSRDYKDTFDRLIYEATSTFSTSEEVQTIGRVVQTQMSYSQY